MNCLRKTEHLSNIFGNPWNQLHLQNLHKRLASGSAVRGLGLRIAGLGLNRLRIAGLGLNRLRLRIDRLRLRVGRLGLGIDRLGLGRLRIRIRVHNKE